ncbi:MAG: hypothetical protein OSB38_37705, partial [Paraburkholderia fungorum]|nr:hypothetical protein [Paraburkholderia fungorum]
VGAPPNPAYAGTTAANEAVATTSIRNCLIIIFWSSAIIGKFTRTLSSRPRDANTSLSLFD